MTVRLDARYPIGDTPFYGIEPIITNDPNYYWTRGGLYTDSPGANFTVGDYGATLWHITDVSINPVDSFVLTSSADGFTTTSGYVVGNFDYIWTHYKNSTSVFRAASRSGGSMVTYPEIQFALSDHGYTTFSPPSHASLCAFSPTNAWLVFAAFAGTTAVIGKVQMNLTAGSIGSPTDVTVADFVAEAGVVTSDYVAVNTVAAAPMSAETAVLRVMYTIRETNAFGQPLEQGIILAKINSDGSFTDSYVYRSELGSGPGSFSVSHGGTWATDNSAYMYQTSGQNSEIPGGLFPTSLVLPDLSVIEGPFEGANGGPMLLSTLIPIKPIGEDQIQAVIQSPPTYRYMGVEYTEEEILELYISLSPEEQGHLLANLELIGSIVKSVLVEIPSLQISNELDLQIEDQRLLDIGLEFGYPEDEQVLPNLPLYATRIGTTSQFVLPMWHYDDEPYLGREIDEMILITVLSSESPPDVLSSFVKKFKSTSSLFAGSVDTSGDEDGPVLQARFSDLKSIAATTDGSQRKMQNESWNRFYVLDQSKIKLIHPCVEDIEVGQPVLPSSAIIYGDSFTSFDNDVRVFTLDEPSLVLVTIVWGEAADDYRWWIDGEEVQKPFGRFVTSLVHLDTGDHEIETNIGEFGAVDITLVIVPSPPKDTCTVFKNPE